MILEEKTENINNKEPVVNEQEKTLDELTKEEEVQALQEQSVIGDLSEESNLHPKESDLDENKKKIIDKPKNDNAKWYILQAYSGYEGRVEKTIYEKLKIKGLENLVNEIFIPSEDVIHTKDGKKRKINQKYFPGYVLIHMELTSELWHLLMDVNRVSGFIGGTQKKPLPLDDKELEEIRSQVNEGIQQKATEEEFTLGQKVTITEGSFGNFSGIIDDINLERRKLKVLVSIFGRPTPVEVEFEKVKNLVE